MARRRRRGTDEWRGILDELNRSGETLAEFCGRRDLSPWSLKDWRRRLGHGPRRAGRPARSSAFVSVATRSAASIRIVMSCGLRLEVPLDCDAQLVGLFVRSLAAMP